MINGLVAQLGERCVRNAEVEGSIPFGSTNIKDGAAVCRKLTLPFRFLDLHLLLLSIVLHLFICTLRI